MHLCKVGHWYEAMPLLIKNPKSLPDFLLNVTVVDLSGDKGHNTTIIVVKNKFQNYVFFLI